MLVREIREDEIPDVITKGKAFEEATKEVTIDVEYAIKKFQDMVASGYVTMLGLFNDEGVRIGGLAYVKAPDLWSAKVLAVELYWFVHPQYRGGGKILIDAFEASAKEKGCTVAAMIHLVDSFPETLKVFYEKRGYHLTEQHYVKEI